MSIPGKTHLIIEFVQGAALLLTLGWLTNINVRVWRGDTWLGQVAAGSAFGHLGVNGMSAPIKMSSGVIFDAQSVLISMADLFGRVLVGGVAALIAEGVETDAQRYFLARHARHARHVCRSYQGYLFSRVLPPVEFEPHLTLAPTPLTS